MKRAFECKSPNSLAYAYLNRTQSFKLYEHTRMYQLNYRETRPTYRPKEPHYKFIFHCIHICQVSK